MSPRMLTLGAIQAAFGDDLDAELVGTHASDGFDEGLAESDRAAWEVPQPATWTLCALSQPDP